MLVAAMMLLVPLTQTDLGGGGSENNASDSVVLSDDSTEATVSNLNDLESAISNGSNIKLAKDITISGLTGPLTLKDKTTLDLNGHTLTIQSIDNISNSNRLVIEDDATVIIENGTIVYSGELRSKSPVKLGDSTKVYNNGTNDVTDVSKLTLNNVIIKSTGYGVSVFSNANLNVTNSIITAEVSAIATNGTSAGSPGNSCGSTVSITDSQCTSIDSAAIFFPGGAKLDVNGGTFTGKTGFDIRSGTVTIDDATINVLGSPSEKKLTDDNKAGGNGPTSWGMGIAVFNMNSYGQDASGTPADISVTVNSTTTINNEVYKLYIGGYDLNKTYDTNGKFIAKNDETKYTPVHKCTVTLDGIEKCNISSTNESNVVLIDGTRSADTSVQISMDYRNMIFANGTPITISGVTGGNNSKITYGSDNEVVFVDNFDLSTFTVFGGSNNAGETVTSSEITMNGGKAYGIVGGGYGNATVGTSTITIDGGKATYVAGGGWSTDSSTTAVSLEALKNKTTTTNVTINGGDILYAVGGGRLGYTHVETANLTINGGNFDEIVAGVINGYTGTAKLTIDASSGKSIVTGLISSGNRGQVSNVTVNIQSLGTEGNVDLVSIGALSGLTATDGGPNAIFDKINFTIAEDVKADNIYLGGATWSNGTSNPWAVGRVDSLSATDITINAGGHKITAADIPIGVKGSYGDYASQSKGIAYTIDSDKTWTLNSGTLEVKGEASLTINGAFTNNGTICYDSLNVDQNGLIIKNIQGSGELQVKDTTFTTKGLYIKGTNNVTITGCKFNSITNDLDLSGAYMHHPSAIHVDSAEGTVTISKNILTDIYPQNESANTKKFMGISVTSNNESAGSVDISENEITNVLHNAIYTNGKFSSILIKGNTIDNWAAQPTADKGRAIRIDTLSASASNIIISENTFVKTYTNPTFGDTGSYDDGNILKITGSSADFKDNVLRLTGITDYSDDKLFKFDDKNTRFLVTFNANGGYFLDNSNNENLYSLFVASKDGATTISQPDSKLINRSGSYTFAEWYDSNDVKWDFDTPIDEDKTLYAKWTYTGGSGGYPVNPPVTPDTPEEPIIPDSSGNAEIKVDDKKADELVHETVASGSNTLSIVDKDNVEGTVTSVSISVSDLETISKKIENNNNIDSISIATSEGEVIIEKEVLAEILENNSEADTLIIEVNNAENKLTEEQKKVVGDNPVYDINLRLGDKYVTSFNGKSITVSIPYELKEGEDQNNLIVYYLKDDGSIEKMNCSYKDNQVSFETNHLSKFIIVYEAQEPIVPDNPDDKNDDNNSDNTIYYIIAAVIIILIIIALAYYFMKKK